eukprot:COSAG02_NODE_784_length_17232_cov_12.871651_1_plen_48_part_00
MGIVATAIAPRTEGAGGAAMEAGAGAEATGAGVAATAAVEVADVRTI